MPASPISTEEFMTLVRERLNMDISDPALNLLEEGYLDSLLLVELLLLLETEFGIILDLEELDLDCLRSVNSITELVNSITDDT